MGRRLLMRLSPLVQSLSAAASSSGDHRPLLPHPAGSSAAAPPQSSASPSSSAFTLKLQQLLHLGHHSSNHQHHQHHGHHFVAAGHSRRSLSPRVLCAALVTLVVLLALSALALLSAWCPASANAAAPSVWCRLSTTAALALSASPLSFPAALSLARGGGGGGGGGGAGGVVGEGLALRHDDVHLAASFSAQCGSAALCPFHALSHLVVVAGHAVLTSLDFHNLTDDAQWELQSFQHGQLSTFLRHIEEGIAVAAADPTALLLFSGGETRGRAGPRSEAQSYWMVAELQRWFGHSGGRDDWDGVQAHAAAAPPQVTPAATAQWSVRSRASTEEFARDSYENLLFSICRFHELTQRYPERITVVGFTFKRARFTQLHRAALRYPHWQFDYIGINPVSTATTTEYVAEQEHVNSFLPFSSDPYGCAPPLSTKRLQRNPFRRSHGYGHQSSCPDLRELIHYCGPAQFAGPLPWDRYDSHAPS